MSTLILCINIRQVVEVQSVFNTKRPLKHVLQASREMIIIVNAMCPFLPPFYWVRDMSLEGGAKTV